MFDRGFQVAGHPGGQADRGRMPAQHPPVLLGEPRERLLGIGV
jgi:hypothetical protein